ncbi:MAG TPA: hypothetical protein VJR29_03175 [bacterium]|nr:hypothetical protein [bacterium]
MRYLTKISFGLMVISFFGPVGLSRLAHAAGRVNAQVTTASMCDKLNDMTDEQREQFGVVDASCVANNPELTAHAFVLGCHNCAGATYSSNGSLVNTSVLHKIPTSYLLKMPENWNGKFVVVIPPGRADQPADHVTFWSQPFMNALLNEGYAAAVMDNPTPGSAIFPYEDFISSYSTKDNRNGYLATGHQLKDLVTDIFGAPAGTYGLGYSRGVLRGAGFLVDEAGAPFDGYVLVSGGNGVFNTMLTHIEAFKTNLAPLTNLTPFETTAAVRIFSLVAAIAPADPEYRAYILSGSTEEERLERAMAYDVSERPKDVRREWGKAEYGPELKKPTINIHGLKDLVLYPIEALKFSERVIEADRSDVYRLYLVRDMPHAVPQSVFLDSIHKLDAWVQNSAEPGPLDASEFGLQQSCTALSLGTDPLDCFCAVMGGVDFASNPIPECG